MLNGFPADYRGGRGGVIFMGNYFHFVKPDVPDNYTVLRMSTVSLNILGLCMHKKGIHKKEENNVNF